MTSPYKRVLLKLSGEVFGGGKVGVDPDMVAGLAAQIGYGRTVRRPGRSGGRRQRHPGARLELRGMERDRADYMGMFGTVMNCLAL